MARTVLTNADWAQIALLFPKRGPALAQTTGRHFVGASYGRTLARRAALLRALGERGKVLFAMEQKRALD